MQHTTIAVDLAKSVFQVAISRRPGRVDEEHRLSRARFLRFFATQPAATVLLEACGSAPSVVGLLQPIDGRNAGVVQAGENLGFPLEPSQAIRI